MFRLTLPLLLAFHTPAAYAKHRVCSWEDQGWYSPSNYGYDHNCLSNVTRLDATRAVYACWNDTKVADYGFLAPGKLEVACPCGSHGYADLCGTTQYWGVCVGPANEQVDPDHVSECGERRGEG